MVLYKVKFRYIVYSFCFLIGQEINCNPLNRFLKTFFFTLSGGSLILTDLLGIAALGRNKGLSENITSNTKEFIVTTFKEAGYSDDEIKKIKIYYGNSFESAFNTICIPFNDRDLKNNSLYNPKENLVYKASLLHEIGHVEKKQVQKTVLFMNLSCALEMYWCRKKSRLSSKSIIALGILPVVGTRILQKLYEYQADYNVIKRAKNPEWLEQFARFFNEQDRSGGMVSVMLKEELTQIHPNDFFRSYYFTRAAEKMRKINPKKA